MDFGSYWQNIKYSIDELTTFPFISHRVSLVLSIPCGMVWFMKKMMFGVLKFQLDNISSDSLNWTKLGMMASHHHPESISHLACGFLILFPP